MNNGPNKTVAAWRNRKTSTVATDSANDERKAEEKAAEMRKRFPNASIRVTRCKVGRRPKTWAEKQSYLWVIRAYEKA